jgi:hypothetical protein
MRRNLVIVVAAVVALLAIVAAAAPLAARAQEAQPPPAPAEAAAAPAAPPAQAEPASKDEVRALAEEVRRLKLQMGLGEVEYASYAGLGPAASKVYFAPKGLSLGGYAEIFYRNEREDFGGADPADDSDLYRVVLYLGYRFTPKIVFNAEIEFEHQNEIHVEFAYLDFHLSKAMGVRAGNVLVPIGFVNELHEPPFFHGVFRPEIEQRLIPTTWNENGVGLHGELGPVGYKAYLLVGLNATNGRVAADTWLRGARTAGGRSPAEDFAGVLNLRTELGPVSLGGTLYAGRAGQGKEVAGEEVEASVFLGEAHARLLWRGLEARAIYAVGTLGDADLVSEAAAIGDPTRVIGSRVQGGYAEVAYDVLGRLWADGGQALSPFVRYERYDLHDEVPGGGVRNPAYDVDAWTVGIGYKPIPTVALKADWSRREAASGAVGETVNLGVGLVF